MDVMLKPRHQKFVQSFVENGGNATRAAQSAGYGDGGHYSRTAGYRLMTNGDIWQAIRHQSEQMGLTPEKILKRLEAIIDKGKDSDSIQAIRTWGDLTGSFAPKSVRQVEDFSTLPRNPEEIDLILEKMRKTVSLDKNGLDSS